MNYHSQDWQLPSGIRRINYLLTDLWNRARTNLKHTPLGDMSKHFIILFAALIIAPPLHEPYIG